MWAANLCWSRYPLPERYGHKGLWHELDEVAHLVLLERRTALTFIGSSGEEMDSKRTTWESIPSIEGLEVDWEYDSEGYQGRRSYARMKNGEISYVLEVKEVLVRVMTGKMDLTGPLNDISQGGLSVILHKRINENMPVKVGLLLGREKIVSRAEIKQVLEVEGKFLIGMQFVDLDEDKAQYIGGIYTSKTFNLR